MGGRRNTRADIIEVVIEVVNEGSVVKSRKRSQEPSGRLTYSIKIIKRNIICNRIGNRTIRITGAINRRSNIFLPLSKTFLRVSYLKLYRNTRFRLELKRIHIRK